MGRAHAEHAASHPNESLAPTHFHFNQLSRLFDDYKDEDQDDVFDDNHVIYLLIGLSTDFGSGSDKVTGPKALKPQGLLVRGLTCIS